MKARLVRIGNSRGIRLPRPLIEEAHLPDDVDLRVEDGTIVIAPAKGVRQGWLEAARRSDHGDPPDPGDAGRDGVHQHRRGIGGAAAGDVDPDRIQRRPAPAEFDPGGVGEAMIPG